MYDCLSGKRLTICHCEENAESSSWAEAFSHYSRSKDKGKELRARMLVRLKLLAENGQLRSPDYWNKEAKLPNDSHFYAVKVLNIRAYGWFSTKHSGVFLISHYSYKNSKKLSKKNTNKIIANWRKFEE